MQVIGNNVTISIVAYDGNITRQYSGKCSYYLFNDHTNVLEFTIDGMYVRIHNPHTFIIEINT